MKRHEETLERNGKKKRRAASSMDYPALIRNMYHRVNPAKIADVPRLLSKYAGCEEALYLGICQKYN